MIQRRSGLPSWNRFLEVCGAASAYSLPEARQALANGVFELVIVALKLSTAAKASASIPAPFFTLTAKEPDLKAKIKANNVQARSARSGNLGEWVQIKVIYRADKFDLEVKPPSGDDAVETHRNLEREEVTDFLEKAFAVVQIDKSVTSMIRPSEGEYVLTGGKDAIIR